MNTKPFSFSFFLSFVYLLLSLKLFLFEIIREDEIGNMKKNVKMFNFASNSAGAIILDKDPPDAKGFNNLLNDDKDKYGLTDCAKLKYVVIGLSEDIMVTSIILANYEKYSSMVQDFQVLASVTYPTNEWEDLGKYTAEYKLGEQVFNITQAPTSHTRILKIKFLSYYQVDYLCTLSQIKVHGLTVIATLQQEVESSSHNVKDMLNTLIDDDTMDSLLLSQGKSYPTSDQPSNNSIEDSTETVQELEMSDIPVEERLIESTHNETNPEEIAVDDIKDQYQTLIRQTAKIENLTLSENEVSLLSNDLKNSSISSINIFRLITTQLPRLLKFSEKRSWVIDDFLFQDNSLPILEASNNTENSEVTDRGNKSTEENIDLSLVNNSTCNSENKTTEIPENNLTTSEILESTSNQSEFIVTEETQLHIESEVDNKTSTTEDLYNPSLDVEIIANATSIEISPDILLNISISAQDSNLLNPTVVNSSINQGIQTNFTSFTTSFGPSAIPSSLFPTSNPNQLLSSANIAFTCLDSLNFDEFQKKMLAKLSSRNDDPLATTPPPSSLKEGMNVFRELVKRIRALKMNEAILEMYITQVRNIITFYLFRMISNYIKLFLFS